VSSTLNELSKNPSVESVSIDKLNKFAKTPNDINQDQWYLKRWNSSYGVNAEATWDITTGTSDVTIAVIDTGKINHPDLTGKWLPGWDFVQNDNNPTDPGRTPGEIADSEWHGTAIAGVIAAATDNGVGMAGINWNSKIVPVRVGGGDGAYDSAIIKGILWAAGLNVSGAPVNSNPAKLINVSWGGEGDCSTEFQEAIDAAHDAGSLVVVAAGNDDDDAAYYSPANCANVVSVGASDTSGDFATFTNYGPSVDLLAPGVSIYTANCTPTITCSSYGYGFKDGTSFSAPIVVGVASLMLSVNPTLTPVQIENLLIESASDVQGLYYECSVSVCGIVDAFAATQSALDLREELFWTDSTTAKVTLPLNDSYQDTVSVSFDTGSNETAYVSILNSLGNDTLILNQAVTPVARTSSTFRGQATITPIGLEAGSFTIHVTQGDRTLGKDLVVNSGKLATIKISKSSDVYPYKDGYKDSATITVTGKDSLGNIVPVKGKITLNKIPITLTSTKQTATWDWSKIPKGTHNVVVSGEGYVSGPTISAQTQIVVGASVASRATISRSSSSVYPTKDGYLDTVALTFSVATSTGKAVPGSAAVTILQGTKKIQSWAFSGLVLGPGKSKSVSWNGKVSGKVVPGAYKAEFSYKSSENGKIVKAVTNITVGASIASRATISRSTATVYPTNDGYLDTVALTFSVATSTGKAVPGSAAVTILQGTKKIQSWSFSGLTLGPGKSKSVSWNGKVSGKVVPGTYRAEFSYKSSENGKVVKAVTNITVSAKKRVLKTKLGPWYTAASSIDYCDGGGYYKCYYYRSTGIEFYNGASYDDFLAAQHSLPFPIGASSVASWRIHVNGMPTDADYYLFPCEEEDDDCSGSDPAAMYFSGNFLQDRIWTSGYSKMGISDGYADWEIVSLDWGFFYVYRYQIEVTYWALE
jgi:subtilisin family serine protease